MYTDVAELLKDNGHRHPRQECTFRWEYRVGVLGWNKFAHVLNYGRSAGLDITLFPTGGLLFRYGHGRAKGEWAAVRDFAVRLGKWAEDA